MKKKFFKKSTFDQLDNYLEKKKEKKFFIFTKFYSAKYKIMRNEILSEYAKKLNLIHNKNFTTSEWQVIIGPWLDKSLSIYLFYSFFFKTNNFNKFFKNYRKNYKFEIPKDYNEFLKLVNNREFYPFFISSLKFDDIELQKIKKIKLSTKFNWKLYFLKFVNYFVKKPVYLSNSRFGNKNLLKLFLFSLFKIIPIPNLHNNLSIKYLKETSNLRVKFCKSFNKNNKNFHIFKILNTIIPKFYLEYFEDLNLLGNSILKKPKKIYTDSTYIDDELLKIQLANWKNQKFKKLIIAQHGGNYNLYKSEHLGTNENDISDIFINWSSNKKRFLKNLTSIRLNYFYESNKIYLNSKKKNQFCFVVRPLRKTNFQSVFMELFLYKKKVKEISYFLKNVNQNLIIKYYPEFRYPDQLSIQEMSKEFEIAIKKIKTNKDIIFKSKLIIFEYISTMLFEILSFNVPFLLVLDEKKHSLSKFGNEFIKDLKKMNLHFSNYNDLKSFLNKGNDINLWWFEEKRQKKLRNFKRKFSNTNYNYVSDWEKYFLV
tara:strand:- start:240 stop:1859 length:1620 start_codon:yes stop_codon:yes gene_type:complete